MTIDNRIYCDLKKEKGEGFIGEVDNLDYFQIRI